MNEELKATAVWTDAGGGSLFVAITGRRAPDPGGYRPTLTLRDGGTKAWKGAEPREG